VSRVRRALAVRARVHPRRPLMDRRGSVLRVRIAHAGGATAWKSRSTDNASVA
jgi:hypothetical protein